MNSVFIRSLIQILRARGVRFTLLAFLLLGAVLGFAFEREMRFIRTQSVSSWNEDVQADCAVVLTGGLNRVREGIDLLSRHSVQKLIISGVNPAADFKQIFPLWPYYGVLRDEDVILERRSLTTFGNALQTLPLVEALRCRDIVLITGRAHMRRALKTFRAEFPPGFSILPRAVSSGSLEQSRGEVAIEAAKSLFYSTWAY